MDDLSTPTFESLRDDLARALNAPSELERRITWVGRGRSLAYARNVSGELEMFLVGDPLHPTESVVRERLVHDSWETTDGTRLPANRLWLPAGDHYDAIAATILIELLDREYESRKPQAFRMTEPLIALVLGKVKSESAALTGLAGELLTLSALLQHPGDTPAEVLLDAWQGWGRSSRDFQIGTVGIEVKTSTTSASRHHIQGWYQIECGLSAEQGPETDLYLLSIGIQWLNDDARGATIESLVQQIMSQLPERTRTGFLDSVRGYCGLRLQLGESGVANQASLRRPFLSTFERLYDLQDPRIRLPRSVDLAHFSALISDSVTFEIELPERVQGDRNPVVGLKNSSRVMLASVLGQRNS